MSTSTPATDATATTPANDAGPLLSQVARVLYITENAAPGHESIASGLAAFVMGEASGEDAVSLVRGLTALAAHRASEAENHANVDGARERLEFALDALDAAALVARAALAAFDPCERRAPLHSVEVRAA